MFLNCISLGWFCGTAGSMAKLGLRGTSGPFDWFFSDLQGVISLMDDDFAGFMAREDLVVSEDNPKRFLDIKHGFKFFHDIKTCLDDDYGDIYRKYTRRAARMVEMSKEPTLFLRTVRSPEEKHYITENHKDIDRIIKKHNHNNMIVYLTADPIVKLPDCVRSFELHVNEYSCDAASTRNMFDNAPELLRFFEDTTDVNAAKRNRLFDASSNYSCAANIYSMIKSGGSEVAEALKEIFKLNGDDGVSLWGIGYHGKAMFEYLTRMGVAIDGLTDSARFGERIGEYTIMPPEALAEGSNVYISVADPASAADIRNRLVNKAARVSDYRELYSVIRNLQSRDAGE